MEVSISPGNKKLGAIPSVSLPPGLTCPQNCACFKKCYAAKLERLRPNVKRAYKKNYEILQNDMEKYWKSVEATIKSSHFFRFHVSGDIPDEEYFRRMVAVAERNKHCEILCFTKKYSIVNGELDNGMVLPSNLHILFSVWKNMECDNKYGLPEAHVRYRDGTTTASARAVECSGNCFGCAITIGGCWSLGNGDQVVFDEH